MTEKEFIQALNEGEAGYRRIAEELHNQSFEDGERYQCPGRFKVHGEAPWTWDVVDIDFDFNISLHEMEWMPGVPLPKLGEIVHFDDQRYEVVRIIPPFLEILIQLGEEAWANRPIPEEVVPYVGHYLVLKKL